MNGSRPKYFAVKSAAGRAGIAKRTLQLGIEKGQIEPDADLVFDDGRVFALFEAATILRLATLAQKRQHDTKI